jgi:hypothetical protein
MSVLVVDWNFDNAAAMADVLMIHLVIHTGMLGAYGSSRMALGPCRSHVKVQPVKSFPYEGCTMPDVIRSANISSTDIELPMAG